VRRHVIGAFVSVLKHAVAIGHNLFHERFQVRAHGRVGILAQYQRRAGVVNENLADALFDTGALNGFINLAADVESSAASGRHLKLLLINHAD
jgi:hypothetical protein